MLVAKRACIWIWYFAHSWSFVGALTKKLRYISRFSSALNFVLGLQVFVGTAYLVLFFTDKSEFVDRCIAGSKDQDVINECNRQATSSKGVMIASVVIPPLIQLCSILSWLLASTYVYWNFDRRMLHRRGIRCTTRQGEEESRTIRRHVRCQISTSIHLRRHSTCTFDAAQWHIPLHWCAQFVWRRTLWRGC